MLIERVLFRYFCSKGDKENQKRFSTPGDIERRDNISYGKHGKWNLLDVFCPKGTIKPLPTIINIHGGGYVYGTKNQSQYYCMNIAQRGFTVVSFSYRLAPRIRFPMPVIETNEVMKWVCANASLYNIDLNNIFLLGDSAGAQIASQYAAMVTNPDYMRLFDLVIPSFNLKAVALNCGMYESFHKISGPMPGLLLDYFGKDPSMHGDKINVTKFITSQYPPVYIMSAPNDILFAQAKPMHEFLLKMGVESVYKIYGTAEEKDIGHVFHINFITETARQCNDDECAFFKAYVS